MAITNDNNPRGCTLYMNNMVCDRRKTPMNETLSCVCQHVLAVDSGIVRIAVCLYTILFHFSKKLKHTQKIMKHYWNLPAAASFLSAMMLFSATPEALATDIVTVNTKKAKKVQRVEYGWHYEEIGMIGDGGLYAELVRNRNFEEANLPEGLIIKDGMYADMPNPKQPIKQIYQIDPLVGWLTLPLTNSPIRVKRTTDNPLNANNSHSMRIDVLEDISNGSDAAIVNTGYFGMAFKQGVGYRLSLYALARQYEGALEVCLADKDGKPCSTPVTITLRNGDSWEKHNVTLTAQKSVADGMLRIVPTKKGTLQLDMVSMFPGDTYDGGKSVFRADIVQNLKDYRPDFLRFPGGCNIHGVNEETMNHWKKTVGDIAMRPGQWGKWEPHYRSDGLGMHEFYELCEYLGCNAMYVIPVGMVCTEWVKRDKDGNFMHKPTDVNYYIQDALDAIEYAIGPTDSKYGAMRAENGHPEPFPLKYVEIGNEDFGPVYYEKYHQIYKALKERYPHLIYIANSTLNDRQQEDIDKFVDKKEIEVFGEHYYRNVQWAIDNFHRFDHYKRQGIRLYIAELGIMGNGVGGPVGQYPTAILAEGIFKMALERNADLKPIMADRPLMRNWECINRGDLQPMLLNSSTQSVKTFNYHLCKMLRDNTVDVVYDVSNTEGEKNLFVTAGKDTRTGEYIVKIINLGNTPATFSLNLNGRKFTGRADITTLTAKPDQRATPDNPNAVNPEERRELFVKSTPTITVAEKSFTIYRMK